MKDKIGVPNNAGKTTPEETAPMAYACTNATVFKEIENLASTTRPRKGTKTSSKFFCQNRKVNDKIYQTP